MPHTHPMTEIELRQIRTRNDQARHVVAGCASATPTLAAMWQYLHDALSDTAALAAQATQFAGELDRIRLDRANLLAAMRAALAAHADGEADPLWYLRDELNAPERSSASSRRQP